MKCYYFLFTIIFCGLLPVAATDRNFGARSNVIMIIRRHTKTSGTFFCLMILGQFFLLNAVLFTVTEAAASSRYVTPSAEVVIRTGQGTGFKVIGMVRDGDAVELLEEGDDYAKVRLAGGKEGWMLKRFLSVDPPLATVVESLREENEQLKQREIEATRKLDAVSTALAETETKLMTSLAERDQIKADYLSLQQDTADVIRIKEEMLQATQQNELLVQEMASIKEENSSLNKDKSINWFLAGGGVLLVGMFIGRLFSKSRKRKSSLM
jgi:SH3 domain protein